jgi:hypothetical protein
MVLRDNLSHAATSGLAVDRRAPFAVRLQKRRRFLAKHDHFASWTPMGASVLSTGSDVGRDHAGRDPPSRRFRTQQAICRRRETGKSSRWIWTSTWA